MANAESRSTAFQSGARRCAFRWISSTGSSSSAAASTPRCSQAPSTFGGGSGRTSTGRWWIVSERLDVQVGERTSVDPGRRIDLITWQPGQRRRRAEGCADSRSYGSGLAAPELLACLKSHWGSRLPLSAGNASDGRAAIRLVPTTSCAVANTPDDIGVRLTLAAVLLSADRYSPMSRGPLVFSLEL